MDDYVFIFCAAGTRENASQMAEALVARRIAACVQLTSIESYYRWEGAVRNEPEILLTIKTTADCFPAIEACIKDLHTYDLPEISMARMIGGSHEYLAWIHQSVELIPGSS